MTIRVQWIIYTFWYLFRLAGRLRPAMPVLKQGTRKKSVTTTDDDARTKKHPLNRGRSISFWSFFIDFELKSNLWGFYSIWGGEVLIWWHLTHCEGFVTNLGFFPQIPSRPGPEPNGRDFKHCRSYVPYVMWHKLCQRSDLSKNHTFSELKEFDRVFLVTNG